MTGIPHVAPPHDLDAEAAVLSAVMLAADKTFPKIADVVRPCDFYSDANRHIADVAWTLQAESRAVDAVTIGTRLRELDQLQQVGGTPYLAQLTDATPAYTHVDDHARTVRDCARTRRLLAGVQAIAAEARSGAELGELVQRVRRLAEDAESGRPTLSALQTHWLNLGSTPEVLNDPPAPQRWLLKHWHGQADQGVFPRGRTGLLASSGGVGKTYALIQLAIAVASGRFWFETFRAAEAGQVLLALGEEDLEEARRRLYRSANAAGLSPAARQSVADRIDLLPLHGVPVALTHSPTSGVYVASDLAGELRQRLEARGVDWSLVIIDPLSRWASGGAEVDNEAATRFCQVIETLTSVRGNPSVLVAHHSSKTSARGGEADARGVTGIRDGFRWMATLDPIVSGDGGSRGVLLRNRKSNYSLEFDDIVLVRNTEPGIEGTLRRATEVEAAVFGPAKGRKADTEDNAKARVVATVTRNPGLRSASQIVERTKGKRADIFAAIKELLGEGTLQKTSRGFETVANGEERTDG